MSSYDVVIVGGGITGLAAAHRLQKSAPELKVLLLEASDRFGGKLKTERVGGFTLEAGADSFLSRKPQAVALCKELGINDKLIGRLPLPSEKSHRAWVKRHDELHPLPDGLTGLIPTNLDALQTTTLLSAEGKARIAQEPEIPHEKAEEDQSVGEFVSNRLGREAYENIVEPLMSGIYAADGDQLSLQSTFPQLAQIVNKHGSLIGGLQSVTPPVQTGEELPPFVSFEVGIEDLVDALLEELDQVELRLNQPVLQLKNLIEFVILDEVWLEM